MQAVGRVVPVVPVALIAQVFLSSRELTELDLKAETRRLLQRLEGAHVYIPRGDLDYALTVGLRMLRLRRLVEERDGLLRVREEELPLLRYYANSIAHFLRAPDGEIR
jgi:glycerol-3-phosphate O-acyltransferase